ncbi:Sec39 domain-containing protein [Apiospora arundinis]|uniref:Sec39 domain-containing protein n=1 Tax=Apiospora arundinis TaxID=335852 RepID=A0ABR2I1H3_9PEZI
MSTMISPAKIILLAVHLATKSDIDSLTSLALRHDKVLQTELVLRILLTCLPETVDSNKYVSLIECLRSEVAEDIKEEQCPPVDWSSVEHFTDAEAAKKVRKLRLLPLKSPNAPEDAVEDPISLFLIHRAHRVDEEAGLLTQLPDLIVPFLDHAPCIRAWMISALLPVLRRNYEYYPHAPIPQTLSAFEKLDDRAAVSVLLDQTGVREEDLPHVGRDLRGLLGPWIYHEKRWKTQELAGDTQKADSGSQKISCPGWEEMLEWLTLQASRSWRVAVKAIEEWDGPEDIDLGDHGTMWLGDDEQRYLEQRYARAALASAYLITEASVEALSGVNSIITKVMNMMGEDPCPTLQVASSLLSPLPDLSSELIVSARNATYMRNDLLEESNVLTSPKKLSAQLLHALTLSAFILTKSGTLCNVRRAGELAFLQDEREQKAEAGKFLRNLREHAPKTEDKYWMRARNELLWLRDWGAEEASDTVSDLRIQGVFGQLDREFLETECLKAILTSGRYALARAIYEDSPERPLPDALLAETIVGSAMTAYDNASNPNRTRGGLLKADDIIHAFPKTIPEDGPAARKIEALLKATHGLGEYRLVLKQGEPFTPVVLRVHSDPISIIGKLLEQNPKSYTRLLALLEIGENMVKAGLPSQEKATKLLTPPESAPDQQFVVEKRITAMCVDAALTEDDFETAYSYVVNRLASTGGPAQKKAANGPSFTTFDEYSWKAALQAGKYRRTSRTIRPTHIGTSSGNLDIRHLEQRMECLSTALRIAPPATLQEILNVFRRCEEELDAAVKAEEQQETAWDNQGDNVQAMPGGFNSTVPAGVVKYSSTKSSRQQEEAPMSLFDLSRATMARAQRNFSGLSSLQQSSNQTQAQTRSSGEHGDGDHDDGEEAARVRKRDQLREAAVGTLASGVGWLIGATPAVDKSHERE